MVEKISYLILPLVISNLIHHFLVIKYNWFTFLKFPIDFKITLFKKRIFGDSKTFRGFLVISLLSGALLSLLSLFYNPVALKSNTFVTGFLLGLAYCLGELPTSFLKRRFGISESDQGSGAKGIFFYFLEQIDSVAAALLAGQFLAFLDSQTNLILLVLGIFLHICLDLVLHFKGYKKSLKKPFYLERQTRKETSRNW